jgi:signal transduction histidine kinase/CHASE3 domain sensor protein
MGGCMGMDSAPTLFSGWRGIFVGVRGRLLASYIVLVLGLLFGMTAAFSSMQVLRTHYTHTVNTVDAVARAVSRIENLQHEGEAGFRGYLLTGDPMFMRRYTAASRALPSLETRANDLMRGDARGTTLLEAMHADARAWQAWAGRYLRQSTAHERGTPTQTADVLHENTLFDRLGQTSGQLTDYIAAERANDLQVSLKAGDRAGGINFLVLVGMLGLVALVAWLTTRTIMGSLGRLAGAATMIGRGDLARPIAISGATEFTRLGDHMDWMRRQLYVQRALAELLGSTLHLDSVWAAFSAGARDLAPFDRLSLWAIDAAGEMTTVLYAEGMASVRLGAGVTLPYRTVSSSLVESTQRYLLLHDLTAVPPDQAREDLQICMAEGIRSLAIVPLRANGREVGTLNISSREGAVYTEELLGPILALAPLVGAAIENARLFRSLDQANQSLGLANRELETFSYSVSHDLRAPLRSIAGFSQALLEDYGDSLDADGKQYLLHVVGSANDMGRLIDDLLHLSRVARTEITYEEVDLAGLARSVGEEMRSANPDRTVTLSIPEHLIAHGNERLLRIVLQNLLGNAWKFTRAVSEARVELGTLERDGRSVYFVRDNGAGFDMTYAHKLFGAFQRLHSAREFEGTGIGLATVQRIIHRHGGQVWAEGVVGRGATIYFTIGQGQGRG